MQYEPLKKTIRFSDEVQNNPFFPQVRVLLKACGNDKFKDWLLGSIDAYGKDSPDFDLMQRIKKHLNTLVSRNSVLDEDCFLQCQQCFYPVLNTGVAQLLEQSLAFFCELQEMERAIQRVSDGFSSDAKTWSQTVKSEADSLPRNAARLGMKYK